MMELISFLLPCEINFLKVYIVSERKSLFRQNSNIEIRNSKQIQMSE